MGLPLGVYDGVDDYVLLTDRDSDCKPLRKYGRTEDGDILGTNDA